MLSRRSINSWMTSKLLSLNSSKTEFLIIGLKLQLGKIFSTSIDTTQSARNLGFIYDEHSHSPIRSLHCLNPVVVQAPKFQHVTPILKSLHWLKVSERIEYKVISLTYKTLNTTQPTYLHDLLSIQPPHGQNTRSSPYVTLIKPSSSPKVIHHSDMLHLIFEPASYTTLEFLIRITPLLSATFI